MNDVPLPPHDEKTEIAILACLLDDPKLCLQRHQKLNRRFFYSLPCQQLYQAIGDLLSCGQKPDAVTAATALKPHFNGNGNPEAFLALVLQSEGLSWNFDSYYETLRQLALRRHLKRFSDEADKAADNPSGDVSDVLLDLAQTAQALATSASTRPGLSLRGIDEFLSLPRDDTDNYLGDRLLAEGQSLVLCGAGGIGKSRLAIQLAVVSTIGRDFLGLETHAQGKKWLILQAENTNRRLQSDIRSFQQWCGPNWPDVTPHIVIHSLDSEEDSMLSLNLPDAQRLIREAIESVNPDIVVIDSLYNYSVGDLNHDVDMAQTLLAISRLARAGNPRRAIVVLHHATTGRAGAAKATGIDRTSFARNSKVIHNWSRAQINLAQTSDDNPNSIAVSCGKCSNGREFDPFGILFDPVTGIYSPDPSFNLDEFKSTISSSPGHNSPAISPDRVRFFCSTPIDKPSLVKTLTADAGCSRQKAYKYIDSAIKSHFIHVSSQSPKGHDILAQSLFPAK